MKKLPQALLSMLTDTIKSLNEVVFSFLLLVLTMHYVSQELTEENGLLVLFLYTYATVRFTVSVVRMGIQPFLEAKAKRRKNQ